MSHLSPYIIDTTLRDGEQAPGVVFSKREKLRIAEMLEILGADEVETGTPAIGYDEQKAIKEIAYAGFSFKTSCWCRAEIKDIRQAARLGTQSVNISLPVSDIQIKTLEKSRNWVIGKLKDTISFAKQYFSNVTLGAQDATRAENKFLNQFIFYAHESGADRIRIADTVGIYDPVETYELCINLKNRFPETEFEFHGHNDLGMATANTIAAIRSGVDCVSATVNGLGERAGNSALEEIIAYLVYKKHNKRFNTKIINRLSHYVSEVSKTNLQNNKAIVGKNAFRHESGIHTSAILKNRRSYQIMDPEDFGADKATFSFGKHSGKASVVSFFNDQGFPISESIIQTILITVKQLAVKRKTPMQQDELMELYFDINQQVKNVYNYKW